MKCILAVLWAMVANNALALPARITPFIRIDQFGYSCNSRKVAVVADPIKGYNARDAYTPGTGDGQYQVRRWQDDAVVFTGTLHAWNDGGVQEQSGDRGWWFDFTSVWQPGAYYIYDLQTGMGSYRFEIDRDVYVQTLKQAGRMFFYQRCNFSKSPPYADHRWTDAAAFEGPQQDRQARSRWDKNNPATAKDLSGGWFDAGDYNKYVPFTVEPLTQLLEAYRLHPSVFTDHWELPESGNGLPDILDEVKFELDWLIRMQEATGTHGLLLKVGADTWEAASPPSADRNKRYYLPECTSSTLSGALVFALASVVYRELQDGAMTAYADALKARAVRAWNRAKVTTADFTGYQTDCDDGDIRAGDADQDADWQRQCALAAAAYLYEATGQAGYKTFVESQFRKVEPVLSGWWGPYLLFVQKALLRYAHLPGVSPAVALEIRESKQNTGVAMGLTEYNDALDLYRAYMPDAQYTWGSNRTKSACGNLALDYVHFEINGPSAPAYIELAEQYLHWLHGVNPEGIVMLSNMYAFGADSSANELYHSWFSDGTVYDRARSSPKGPAPGFVTGGPNRDFSVSKIVPPYNQPAQKAYRDWNTHWNGSFNENSYEITEPAIYYQGMYLQLLASVIDYGRRNCAATGRTGPSKLLQKTGPKDSPARPLHQIFFSHCSACSLPNCPCLFTFSNRAFAFRRSPSRSRLISATAL
ncbi:glycoside hydrolase family 9 protein [Paraflavisolibacter sp. H34]|uniref:glycoside hydrolase family 9 protein n=1 Tax=Huijunlia imazamoxiresistens TaxID=3127457 RepID=UPI003019D971